MVIKAVCSLICFILWQYNGIRVLWIEGTEWKAMRFVIACFFLSMMFFKEFLLAIQ